MVARTSLALSLFVALQACSTPLPQQRGQKACDDHSEHTDAVEDDGNDSNEEEEANNGEEPTDPMGEEEGPVDSSPLMITELADGRYDYHGVGFIELTNLSNEAVDLSEYSLGFKWGTIEELDGGAAYSLQGVVEPGQSWVINLTYNEDGEFWFRYIYGERADDHLQELPSDRVILYHGFATGTGDNAEAVDAFGMEGVSSQHRPWDLEETVVRRRSDASPNPAFDFAEWRMGDEGFFHYDNWTVDEDLVDQTSPFEF